jgi:hypothetical protein
MCVSEHRTGHRLARQERPGVGPPVKCGRGHPHFSRDAHPSRSRPSVRGRRRLSPDPQRAGRTPPKPPFSRRARRRPYVMRVFPQAVHCVEPALRREREPARCAACRTAFKSARQVVRETVGAHPGFWELDRRMPGDDDDGASASALHGQILSFCTPLRPLTSPERGPGEGGPHPGPGGGRRGGVEQEEGGCLPFRRPSLLHWCVAQISCCQQGDWRQATGPRGP